MRRSATSEVTSRVGKEPTSSGIGLTLSGSGKGAAPVRLPTSPGEEVEEVKTKLLAGKFTTEQLQLLRAVIDLRLGKLRAEVTIEVDEVNADHFTSLLYSATSDLVLRRLGQRFPHLGTLKRINPRFFKDVLEASRGLKQFLEEVIPRCGRPQQAAFVRMFVDLAYDQCTSEGGLMTTSRLMKKHGDVGALINQAYPGYIGARMLDVVLSGFTRK